MTLASSTSRSSLGLPFILAEFLGGTPALARTVAGVAPLGSRDVAVVVSALVPLRGAVPALRQHSLGQEAVLRLGPIGFTAGFLRSLSLAAAFSGGFGLGLTGGEAIRRGRCWVVDSGGANVADAGLSRDKLSIYKIVLVVRRGVGREIMMGGRGFTTKVKSVRVVRGQR